MTSYLLLLPICHRNLPNSFQLQYYLTSINDFILCGLYLGKNVVWIYLIAKAFMSSLTTAAPYQCIYIFHCYFTIICIVANRTHKQLLIHCTYQNVSISDNGSNNGINKNSIPLSFCVHS